MGAELELQPPGETLVAWCPRNTSEPAPTPPRSQAHRGSSSPMAAWLGAAPRASVVPVHPLCYTTLWNAPPARHGVTCSKASSASSCALGTPWLLLDP